MAVYEQQRAAYEAAGGENQKKKRRKSSANSEDQSEAKKAKLAKKEVCGTCERSGNVIPCTSGCGSAYHSWCIGLNGIPTEAFKCDACFTGNQRCFVCDSPGGAIGSLMKCDSERCNKYYHAECAKSLPRSKFDSTDVEGEMFFCPLHTCANCDLGVSGKSAGKLIRCIRCPTVYHGGCVPAGVETKGPGRIVCPRHFTKIDSGKARPSCNFCVVCSEGGELVVCDGCPGTYHKECITGTVGNEYKEGSDWHCQDCCGGTKPMTNDVVWCKVGNHRWWPSQILGEADIPEQLWKMDRPAGTFCVKFLGGNEHQWVNNAVVISWMEGDQVRRFAQGAKKPAFQRALDDALEVFTKRAKERKEVLDDLRGNIKEQPQVFKKIRTNLYVCPKPRLIEVPECMCDPGSDCGDDCLNRIMMIECNPKSCPAGSTCTNNRLLKHRYPKLKVWKTESAGFGLRVDEPLEEGNLVCEYIGEVIDEEECQARLIKQEKAGTVSFYILALDSGMYIDARLKASVARFANHSCEPNCNVHKWNVNGLMKIGIFANRAINPGEELTFDYQLDVNGREKMKVCMCGAPSCRGFLGKKKSDIVQIEDPKKKKGKKKKGRRSVAEMRIEKFPWECEFECGYDAATEAEVDAHEAICEKKTAGCAAPATAEVTSMNLVDQSIAVEKFPWECEFECGFDAATEAEVDAHEVTCEKKLAGGGGGATAMNLDAPSAQDDETIVITDAGMVGTDDA
jgi:[histone H3]-lysine36 N-dimethyltransferase NSD2